MGIVNIGDPVDDDTDGVVAVGITVGVIAGEVAVVGVVADGVVADELAAAGVEELADGMNLDKY